MNNRSKVLNARLKISKLKEKYSSMGKQLESKVALGTDLTFDKEVSSYNISSEPDVISEASSNERPKLPTVLNDIDNEINKAMVQSEPAKENISNNELNSPHDFITSRNKLSQSDTLTSISEQSFRSKTPVTLKSESLILSDLSNQFENIRFLSSSSDEENDGFSSDDSRTMTQLEYRSIKNVKEELENSLYKEGDKNEKGVLTRQKEGSEGVSSSETSKIYSEIESEPDITSSESSHVDSGEEISSVKHEKLSEILLLSHELSHECTNLKSLKQLNEQIDSGLKPFTSQSNCTYNIDTMEKSHSVDAETQEEFDHCENIVARLQNDEIVDTTKISNNNHIEPEESINYYAGTPKRKLKHIERVAMQSNNTENPEKTKEVRSFFQIVTNKKVKTSNCTEKLTLSAKKSRLKRPTVKSCALIKLLDIDQEAKDLLFQRLASSELTFPQDYAKKYCAPQECQCGDIISQLLRNQIQLTRYFIESHHRMYLRCCQAVKLLDVNHAKD